MNCQCKVALLQVIRGKIFMCFSTSVLFLSLLHIQNGQTALFIASKKGHTEVTELLLRRDADVNHHTKVRLILLVAQIK